MRITATYINLYHVCKRELWLHANEIRFEHTSDLVYEGRLIHEEAYPQRAERYEELAIDDIKIDFYDVHNKVIHEIKKSNKTEEAHRWQLKYYIYVMESYGIKGACGILEYPTIRHTEKIELDDKARTEIKTIKTEIINIIQSDSCPPVIHSKICRQCSYNDFCYVNEDA